MHIDILKLKEEIEKINNLYEKYEDTYLNLYNELTIASSEWISPKASLFFDNVSLEKKEIKLAIENINSIKNIYDNILDNYQKIGNKISFDLKKKDEILTKIDNYKEKINKIILLYNNIETKYYEQEKDIILLEKQKLENINKNLTTIKKEVTSKFSKIEEIEKEISQKISKIDIDILKESDISSYI